MRAKQIRQAAHFHLVPQFVFLRPGNAGSNTAADHIEILAMALAQLPIDPRQVEVVARADSAGLTHGFVNACRESGVRFSIGYDLTEAVRAACFSVGERAWRPAVTADGGDDRDGAEVTEITHLIDLSRWPAGTRAIARREEPHPGAQLTFTDTDGHRFQVFITDQTDPDIAYLEALQRGRGRAEKLICDAKNTGLTNLPSAGMAINTAWLTTALIAHDLLAWSRLLVFDGDLARAEPKRLRYCVLHVAGLLVRTGRRTHLRLNRPGIRGGSVPWKRGWGYAEGEVTWEADDASVHRWGEGSGGASGPQVA